MSQGCADGARYDPGCQSQAAPSAQRPFGLTTQKHKKTRFRTHKFASGQPHCFGDSPTASNVANDHQPRGKFKACPPVPIMPQARPLTHTCMSVVACCATQSVRQGCIPACSKHLDAALQSQATRPKGDVEAWVRHRCSCSQQHVLGAEPAPQMHRPTTTCELCPWV